MKERVCLRWVLAPLMILIFAVGCSTTTGPTPSSELREPSLEIRRIGVRSGSYEKISLSRGSLRRETRSSNGTVSRDEPIPLTPLLLDGLVETLDRFSVEDWAGQYSNPDVFDGVMMQIEARLDGRVFSTQMINRGPALGEDGELTYSNYGLGLGEDLLRELRSLFREPAM